MNAYQNTVYPVKNPKEWTMPRKVEDTMMLTSNQKKKLGRLAEKRKRSSCEVKQTVKCGRYQGNGHNRRTCTNLLSLSQNSKTNQNEVK